MKGGAWTSVEWYWWGETEVLGARPLPVPATLFTNPTWTGWGLSRVSALRGSADNCQSHVTACYASVFLFPSLHRCTPCSACCKAMNFMQIGARRCGSVSVNSMRDQAIKVAAVEGITSIMIRVWYQCLNLEDFKWRKRYSIHYSYRVQHNTMLHSTTHRRKFEAVRSLGESPKKSLV